jgi:hypothetical protein
MGDIVHKGALADPPISAYTDIEILESMTACESFLPSSSFTTEMVHFRSTSPVLSRLIARDTASIRVGAGGRGISILSTRSRKRGKKL